MFVAPPSTTTITSPALAAARGRCSWVVWLATLLVALQGTWTPAATFQLSRASLPGSIPAPAPLSEEEESHSATRNEGVSPLAVRRSFKSDQPMTTPISVPRVLGSRFVAGRLSSFSSERAALNGCGAILRC